MVDRVGADGAPPAGLVPERRVVVVLRRGARRRDRLVHAALDPSHPLPLGFVAHGVGQGRHRAGGAHLVPVPVEEAVELAQGRGAVAAEDGDAGGPQAPAPEWVGPLDDGREGGDVEVGRSAPPERVHHGVELVSEVGQLGDEGSAADGALEELGVELRQLGHERVPLGLDLDPGPQAEPGLPAEELDRGAPEAVGIGRGAHAGALRSTGVDGCRGERGRADPECPHHLHPQ